MAVGTPRIDSARASNIRSRGLVLLWIVALTALAYSTSFLGPFIFDDIDAIVRNPHIRSLVPTLALSSPGVTTRARPVLEFSFALNYALGGLNVVGYHIANLLIHIFSALLLYGIVRRNLSSSPCWNARFETSAIQLAATAAILWAVHPLNTEAVTYIVQRTESLASMFYLLVIYSLVRLADDRKPRWEILAVLSAFLGMATKEILVTAPIVALLYDRTFLAGSFRKALDARPRLYVGLAFSWLITLLMLTTRKGDVSVGYTHGITMLDYLRTQSNVIAHYLRLCFVPHPLVLDEQGWPIARTFSDITFGWITIALFVATLIALYYKPPLGFLGAWFFLILAPTSSVIPIVSEVAAEHRMYLPSIAIVVLVVVGYFALFQKPRGPLLSPLPVLRGRAGGHVPARRGWGLFIPLGVIAGVLFMLTIYRNYDYRTDVSIWSNTVARRPNNPRAHFELGIAYSESQNLPAAISEFQTALKLQPDFSPVVRWLGQSLIETGDFPAAQEFCDQQIAANSPVISDAYNLRASLRIHNGDLPGALADYQAVATLHPDSPDVHYHLGTLLEQLHRLPEAQAEFEQTEKLSPNFRDTAEHLRNLRASTQR